MKCIPVYDCRKREVLGIDRAGLISLVTFGWLTKYILRAYRRGITLEDIPSIPPSDSCDYNAQRLVYLNSICFSGQNSYIRSKFFVDVNNRVKSVMYSLYSILNSSSMDCFGGKFQAYS